MEKSYNPSSFEKRLYDKWNKSGAFAAEDTSEKPPFTIVIPPPNVTGVLHNGHALMLTIEDVLIRWKRMAGFNALWLPGTDHAGIATQMVVERELKRMDGKSRHDLGREKFIKLVWKWKEKHGNAILNQMKRMGSSLDWKRERFTLDDGLSEAVREVFVRLYEEGLIYRGARLINWCTRCATALSDLEVVPKERKGHFYHLKYISEDGKHTLTIATTRPETLLGDTAIAVNPKDKRYKSLVGKKLKLPLLGRELPVIADEYVDMEFGSGALKVTPGHDFNDYALGKKHKLDTLSILDKDGRINENGDIYKGMRVTEAREKIVEDLKEAELLEKIEDHSHNVGLCQRCNTVVEPMISDQWFVDVKPLADKALQAVKKGEKMTLAEVDARDDAIKIVPENWNATYYHWMENIQDWCISRQLWWGHRIPAWHCKDCNKITVSRVKVSQCSHCSSKKVKQDEDVLDTWFSSALWPFSTLGWPEQTPALKTFYPTSVMETGSDILFFWVARMIMMGIHFNGGVVPFKRVYLHAMVRDEKGQKMSKTKGNVIDPLDIIKDYGTDAFRFTLSAMAGQGRDVKLNIDRIAGYKAFCNKLWNASRYVLLNIEDIKVDKATVEDYILGNHGKLHPINKWILSQLNESTVKINRGLEEFRLNESANEVYSFIWHEYCDWYIEFSKGLLNDPEYKEQTEFCLLYVLEQALKLAHPFIPFITEEIFQNLPKRKGVEKGDLLMLSNFPKPNKSFADSKATNEVFVWRDAIEAVRAFRGENNISPKARPKVRYSILDQPQKDIFERGKIFIQNLAQLEALELEIDAMNEDPAIAEVLSPVAKFFIPMKGLVDVVEELKRLDKQRKDTLNDIEFVKKKLSKESFVSRAPKELVEKERQKLLIFEQKLQELQTAQDRLKQLQN